MLESLKDYAVEHHVPIITDEALNFLLDLIKKHHIEHVLEIGSAIGYSALAMASLGVKVDTIERDHEMLKQAKHNILIYDQNHLIHLIDADALTYEGPLGSYDLIFIDAAKSQYMNFFNRYSTYLTENGMIVCDNLYFHHLNIHEVKNRHTKGLLKRLEKFRHFLINHKDFNTEFIAEGDGLSISKRVKK